MLRPATPLTLLLFAAFALLLLSVLSTPIIKPVPLGSFEGVEFGVFGYCKDGVCTGIEIGYDTSNLFSALDNSSFDLPAATRKTLSAILIVHPVAAAFTLITFVLALFAHMHSPSHSARYLLLLFIVSIIDFLVCLLAFLVDVLVFVPHMAWGSYLVLAATALVALSGLVSCAMRRMIVSRKARKKRIAENAEMSGENFYNRQAQPQTTVTAGMATQPSVPTVSGANGMDKAPQFMALEKRGDRSSDERIPLTARSPEESSPFAYANDAPYYGLAVTGRSVMNAPARDEYGNPLPSQDAYGARRPSNERMRGRGGMPPGGYRGRGGHPGAGRGGYPAYGAPPPGGPRGYGPPGRGGYDGPPARGGYGAPPRGSYVPPRGAYGGGMRGGRTPPPPPGHGNPSPYDRRASPYGPGPQGPPVPYGARPSSAGHPSAPGYDIHNMNPSLPNLSSGYLSDDYGASNLPRAESPPPLPVLTRKESMPRAESPPPLPGIIRADSIPRAESPPPMPGLSDGLSSQATGSNASKAPQGFGQYGVRDSDVDIAGMLALQQGKSFPSHHHDTFMTEGSRYSQDEQYVPPRQGWNQGPSRIPSPLTPQGVGPSDELSNPRGSPTPPPAQASSEYYDDVDPRFANPPMLEPDPVRRPSPPRTIRGPSPPPVQTTASYEEDMPHAGARSPAESERSTFTSISQRGINPRWNPSPAPPFPPQQGGNAIPRRPVNNRPTDVLLNSNPDFQLPTRGGSSKGAGSMIPGSAYPAGPL